MYTSKALPRVRRRRCLAPDFLEERVVMSSGQGSTFAIMPGSITTAGQASAIPFTMNSSLFTPTKDGKMLDRHRRHTGDRLVVDDFQPPRTQPR